MFSAQLATALTASASAPDGGDRRPADRRRASDARSRAAPRAPCRRRRRTPGLEGSPTGQWQVASFSSSSDKRWLIGTTLSIGDRIGLHLDFEGVRKRGVAARDRTRHPHHVLGGARLALPRRGRGGALGAAGKAQPVHLADHGVSRHISEFRGDLAGRQVRLPRASSVARRDRRTRSIPSSHSSLRIAPANRGSAGDVIRLKNPCGQNPLALAGRENRARTSTLYKMDSQGSELPHEMSYPTAQKLQYGGTLAQESAPMRPHVPTHVGIAVRVFHHTAILRTVSSCSAAKAF